MARLLILRGETLDREVELKNKTVRLGRGPQNDVTLEDEGKSVSRNHAEIRFEGGRYVLVDLESQNGVWVAGQKVPYVVLEPNVVASVGPYRLMLEAGGGAAAFRADSGTYAGPTADSGQIDYDSAARKDPRLDPRSGRPGRAARPASNWFSQQPKWLLPAAGAAVIGVAALAVTSVMRGPAQPLEGQLPALMEAHLTTANDLIQAGDCSRALSEHIEPVLASDPENGRALALKDKAQACAPGSDSSEPSAPANAMAAAISANLLEARKQIEAGNCDIAINDHLSMVLASDPANGEALALKIRAEACRATTAPPPTPALPSPEAPILAKRTLPEKGGLEPTQGELQRDYDSRVRVMRARYDEAAAALSNGLFQRADLLISGIIRDAGDRYLDAGKLLLQAKNGLKDTALKIYQTALELEKREEWDKAIQEFRRAQETDPNSFTVEQDLKRVADKKTVLGLKKCDEANSTFFYPDRSAQTLQSYEEVLKLLPPDHPCFVQAKERVPKLRK